ncbi:MULTISPECIES: aldo/keto reductase [Pseudomonas]|jgi:diketogulonate reductase-like aldo/keto reductase|uniref:Aldo/keto reductase n=3 Tax=Pseudomonas fluorescens group TaxID=136843 RepID=A0AB36D4X8_9PSED|nr:MULTISPECIES: aldo/keto reductase [Pseudomonas]MBU0522425.1 aldo/keto reductase [Gammaproteobacteria bacterium]MBA4362430.1 aldo/keto reductase [Pseudomonas sp.]MBU0819233.1 aldo/keto reductase [Gammaproteobacteria bacterium]MBU0842594.1 aldo/keto reductase [Gammaproteobacteria bacterium]MBU1840910.1 aldo/keto reductase [Gammaproteobacteria bacterium]
MSHTDEYTRRQILTLAAGASAVFTFGPAFAATTPSKDTGGKNMLTRAIPSSSEPLPLVGLGTYRGFDVGPSSPAYKQLPAVLRALFEKGGKVIDSSPMYGRAEETTGELLSIHEPRSPAFLATKVWTRGREEGIAQMEQSFKLLQTDRIDLMQIHNLLDWQTHLPTLRKWKEEGRIRYIGITHYTASAYDEVEAVLKAEPLDFLQINYALDDRGVEKRILPLCRERGVAVICNRPFGGGNLLSRLKDKPLPRWAADVRVNSWPQMALKFLLSHPAVTCVIPGTGNPRYMADNAGAGFGPMLTGAQREQLIDIVG